MNRGRILAVDDDRDLLKLLAIRLRSAGFDVDVADSGEEALSRFSVARPDLVLTDLRMAGMNGMALFDAVHGLSPTLPVVVLTAHGTIPDAVDATRRGVFGYLTKPVDPEQLLAEIRRALALAGGMPPSGSDDAWRSDIVTCSSKMQDVLAKARLVAASGAAVLLRGESGTGKELLARAIHRASPRSGGPFVAVNCGAIPEALLEAELFGYVKGAFTGAARDHKGLFLHADGGTLFLDEIGDMPLALQVKLLRVLQDSRVRPLGSSEELRTDVRVISATHRDIEALRTAGTFRDDLYYRLNVIALTLPTLAERREDIPMLANHFLRTLAVKYDKPINAFAPEALESLIAGSWSGNVRQLHNVIEHAVALCPTKVVPSGLVQQALEEQRRFTSLEEGREHFEREYLIQLLKITAGNVTRAAQLAGRNRTEFYKLLSRHRLEASGFRNSKR